MIPAGGGTQRDSSFTPADLLWTSAHAPASSRWGAPHPHLLPGQEEDCHKNAQWVEPIHIFLPSYHTPVPTFQNWKRNAGSKVRHTTARLHMQNTQLSLEDGNEQEGG